MVDLVYCLTNLFFLAVSLSIYILYIYTNLPVNTIVRLPHPRTGDGKGQEHFTDIFSHIFNKKTKTYNPRQKFTL